MGDLLGRQRVAIAGCVVHRLDVRGADLREVDFSDVHVIELVVDRYVTFGMSAPKVDSLVSYEDFREERLPGRTIEWIEKRMQVAPEAGSNVSATWIGAPGNLMRGGVCLTSSREYRCGSMQFAVGRAATIR